MACLSPIDKPGRSPFDSVPRPGADGHQRAQIPWLNCRQKGGWKVEKITVVGSGYVGLVAAACLAELGHSVVCVDNDLARVESLRRGEVPIHEQFLPELLTRHRGNRLEFSDSLPEAVGSSSIIF